MQKTLTYSSFIALALVVIGLFVTSTSYAQLGVASGLYPIVAYFGFAISKRRPGGSTINSSNAIFEKDTKVPPQNISMDTTRVEVADFDKRAFLKIIAGTGISFFVFSLLNRATGTNLFGTVGGSGETQLKNSEGAKINPAEKHPTDGYRISQIDDNIVTYYGFTNNEGAWYIMREDTDNGSFRYTKGDSNFEAGWAKRDNLRYQYYNNTFSN